MDLTLKQPVSVWNREIKTDPKTFLLGLTKAAMAGVGGNSQKTAEELLNAISKIELSEQPEQAAWALVSQAVNRTLAYLVEEYRDLFTDCSDNSTEKNEAIASQLAEQFHDVMEHIEICIDDEFFTHPTNFQLLKEFEPGLKQWLKGLGLDHQQTTAFYGRLRNRFVLELHNEWLQNADKYEVIKQRLKASPFLQATQQQRNVMRYNAWLIEQANARMFGEAFSLKAVYVPLRAWKYKKTSINNDEINLTDKDLREQQEQKVERLVIDLNTEIKNWVLNFDSDIAVRVISGGPGSGKSSFCKLFIAELVEQHPELPVLFIPLHHFDPTGDLHESVERFVNADRILNNNPLNPKSGEKRLLLIFDGLDELAEQGKIAAEIANRFVDEVVNKINYWNTQGMQYQVLLSGRELAVQTVKTHLRKDPQILHILPYHVQDKKEYQDKEKLLHTDQRDIWWQKFGNVSGKNYSSMPKRLNSRELDPITTEPLLNYLVALSFEHKDSKIDFSKDISLNIIYADLLQQVYKRGWENHQHRAVGELTEENFYRVLEEIAIAVWHGNGRTAPLSAIAAQCEKSHLSKALENFSGNAEGGIARLLTAFYFRQSDANISSDNTFEFTHKSFGEYLTAKRLVREFGIIHNEVKRYWDTSGDSGLSDADALRRWFKSTGPVAIDQYLHRFIKNEIANLSTTQDLLAWQNTSATLLAYTVRNGLPVETLLPGRFLNTLEQINNADEALLIIHYCCAQLTKQTLDINWGNDNDFGHWLKRTQGQRNSDANRELLKSLGYLNLSSQYLYITDFYSASLEGNNLQQAYLSLAHLNGANLRNANLHCANLHSADLRNANLRDADLSGAGLSGAELSGAELSGAGLSGADLSGADLSDADLSGADLSGADLSGAELSGAELSGAELEGAKLPKGFKQS